MIGRTIFVKFESNNQLGSLGLSFHLGEQNISYFPTELQEWKHFIFQPFPEDGPGLSALTETTGRSCSQENSGYSHSCPCNIMNRLLQWAVQTLLLKMAMETATLLCIIIWYIFKSHYLLSSQRYCSCSLQKKDAVK